MQYKDKVTIERTQGVSMRIVYIGRLDITNKRTPSVRDPQDWAFRT